MASIFLQYEPSLININEASSNPEVILNLLKIITPPNINPISHRIVNVRNKECIFVNYSSEKDINFIFNPENISKLKAANIKVELTKDCQEKREVFIGEVPEDIATKPAADIITELQDKNNIKILYLNKLSYVHKSNYNYIRYLIIAFETNESRKIFTTKNKSVKLFNIILPAEARRPRDIKNKKPTFQPSNTQVQIKDNQSAQHLGRALASTSDWATNTSHNSTAGYYHQQKPHGYTTFQLKQNNRYRQSQQQSPPATYHPPPPQASYNQHLGTHPIPSTSAQSPPNHSSSDSNLLEVTNIACKTLSQGLENPEVYVYILNNTLCNMGHPSVTIPNSVYDISRDIYYSKNSNSYVNITNPILNTTPTQFQPPHSSPSLQNTTSLHSTATLPPPPANHLSQPSIPTPYIPSSFNPPNHISQPPISPPNLPPSSIPPTSIPPPVTHHSTQVMPPISYPPPSHSTYLPTPPTKPVTTSYITNSC